MFDGYGPLLLLLLLRLRLRLLWLWLLWGLWLSRSLLLLLGLCLGSLGSLSSLSLLMLLSLHSRELRLLDIKLRVHLMLVGIPSLLAHLIHLLLLLLESNLLSNHGGLTIP